MDTVGTPEGKMAKKRLRVAQNFRNKDVLYLILSAFLYCTVITHHDSQIFSKSSLYTTMRVREVPGTKGSGERNKIVEVPDC